MDNVEYGWYIRQAWTEKDGHQVYSVGHKQCTIRKRSHSHVKQDNSKNIFGINRKQVLVVENERILISVVFCSPFGSLKVDLCFLVL
jgi:hypothetical protein